MLLPKAPEGTQDERRNVHIVVLLPDADADPDDADVPDADFPDDADFPEVDADFPDADFPDADVPGDRVTHPEAARWKEGNAGNMGTRTMAGMIVLWMRITTRVIREMVPGSPEWAPTTWTCITVTQGRDREPDPKGF